MNGDRCQKLRACRPAATHACVGVEPTGRAQIAASAFWSLLTSQEVRLAAYGMPWLTQDCVAEHGPQLTPASRPKGRTYRVDGVASKAVIGLGVG